MASTSEDLTKMVDEGRFDAEFRDLVSEAFIRLTPFAEGFLILQ